MNEIIVKLLKKNSLKIRKLLWIFLSDESFVKLDYWQRTGCKINLKNPRLLNEKLQWLKLYYRNPMLTKLADKSEVKKYVGDIIGKEHIIKTYGVWNSFDDIDFDSLPDRFVLKCTHDCGSIIICRDKKTFDYKQARAKLNKHLAYNFYRFAREWQYKDIVPRIIAEEYLEQNDKTPLVDYKFFCYGGKPRYFMYSLGEAEHNARLHNFDVDLRSVDHLFKKTPAIKAEDIVLPQNINEMIDIAQTLCKDYQFIRVDLYNVDGKIYFGEMTFTTATGFLRIDSEEYAFWLAGLIDLDKCKSVPGDVNENS